MVRNVMIVALAASFSVVPGASAQQWLTQLPQKPETTLRFNDYRQAFEDYYKQHPVNLGKEKLRPTFRFESTQEVEDRVAIEGYKLFKRWEWLTEPRTYPSGKWDFEKIDAIRQRLETDDNDLLLKQTQTNPLKLKFERGKIIWPPIKFWKPLGPSDAIGGTNLGRVNSIQFDPTT